MRALPARRAGRRADPAGELDRRGGARRSSPASERGRAALGHALAAEIYGGIVLREGVEDRDDNETRFVWLARDGRRDQPPAAARDRRARGRPRSCSGAPAPSAPGWLVRCLDEFARREINLTKIESRPRRERLGSYMFFADLAAARCRNSAVAEAIAGLRRAVRAGARARLLPGGRARRRRRRREPAAGRRRTLRRAAPPLHCGAEDGEHCPTRAGGVRVAFTSTSGTDLSHRPHGDGRPGARSERDVRADQRLHGAPRGGAAAEGEGRAARARRAGSCTPRARRSRGRS